MAAPQAPRTRLSAPERREQLLDVTTALVLERSFHEVSIDAVAKHAGITRAVVYQHFDDLAALFDAVVERALDRAREQARAAAPDLGGDAHTAMLASVEAYVGAVIDDPDTWRLVLMQPDGAPETVRKKIADGRNQLLAAMTADVRPVFAASDDPELTASALSVLANNYAHLALADPEQYSSARLLRHADWMIRGFLDRG
ncbi:MAG: TetR/AcrR family transcriptional regulator [Solirubrobacterales bacterium]